MANNNLKRKPISNSVGNFDKDVAKAKAERVEEEREPVMGTLQEEYDLIAGYRDSDGKLHRTFTIRQMNGEDEEALFRFNKMSNMKQMVMLCERLVESIGTIKKSDVSKKAWHDIIQNLYAADLDYIFLRLQAIYNVVLQDRRSVIIFDEVQMCPPATDATNRSNLVPWSKGERTRVSG